MRRASKVDANQGEVVDYLRKRGAVVDIVSMVPNLGYDLIVYFMGVGAVVEVKDGSKPPSARELTDSEKEAARRWGDRYYVVHNLNDCSAMLGEMRGVA